MFWTVSLNYPKMNLSCKDPLLAFLTLGCCTYYMSINFLLEAQVKKHTHTHALFLPLMTPGPPNQSARSSKKARPAHSKDFRRNGAVERTTSITGTTWRGMCSRCVNPNAQDSAGCPMLHSSSFISVSGTTNLKLSTSSSCVTKDVIENETNCRLAGCSPLGTCCWSSSSSIRPNPRYYIVSTVLNVVTWSTAIPFVPPASPSGRAGHCFRCSWRFNHSRNLTSICCNIRGQKYQKFISKPSSFWHRGLEISLKDGFQFLGLAPDEKVWSESFCLCHPLHNVLLHHLQIWERTWYGSNK